jgi:hypothetical protein
MDERMNDEAKKDYGNCEDTKGSIKVTHWAPV